MKHFSPHLVLTLENLQVAGSPLVHTHHLYFLLCLNSLLQVSLTSRSLKTGRVQKTKYLQIISQCYLCEALDHDFQCLTSSSPLLWLLCHYIQACLCVFSRLWHTCQALSELQKWREYAKTSFCGMKLILGSHTFETSPCMDVYHGWHKGLYPHGLFLCGFGLFSW